MPADGSTIGVPPAALREVRFRRLLEGLPQLIWAYRGNGECTLASRRCRDYALAGADAERIVGWLALVHADDRVQAEADWLASLRGGMDLHTEVRLRRHDGVYRWFELRAVPLAHDAVQLADLCERSDGAGAPSARLDEWVLTGTDIHDARELRQESERVLVVSQAQLDSALEAAQMGAWVVDTEQNTVWGNESQRALWQLSDDVPSWYSIDLARTRIHPDDVERVDREMARAYATGERLEMEFRLRLPNGVVRWIAMRSRAELDAHGKPRRIAGINLDVTQQRLVAEATLRSQKLESLGTLAGGIAHDFNNVLFAIEGNAELALDLLDPKSAVHPYLEQIAGASRRATELVAQILAFSRPHDQKLEVGRLEQPVQEAVRMMRATIPAMISIECQLDPRTPAVLADSSRLVQVIVNLFTNAVHAIGKGNAGLIEVSVAPLSVNDDPDAKTVRVPRGEYAVLSVSDNGCGMDEQTLTRIFDPFFTTKPPGEGTGLGLSVAHGIVQALGGLITVYSQVGKGTSFRLYFPATRREPVSERPPRAAAPRGRGQRILFVDDEPTLVQLAKGLLTALGYQPVAFTDAHQALLAFEREPQAFCAAVTDLSMPNMSGFELSRALLSLRSDLPILLMSGYVGPEERTLAGQIGVRELVLKPVTMDQLAQLLARLC